MRPIRPALLLSFASALLAVTGCGRSKPDPRAASAVAPAGTPALDLSSRPQLLFEVFGDRDDPKIIPLAAVVDGVIKPIALTPRGWRELDSAYFAPGAKYPIYHDDILAGEVVVTRGMWADGNTPLYPLPGCRNLKPVGSGTITFKSPHNDPTVEFVASTAPLVPHPPFTGTFLPEAEIARLGRAFGHEVGKAARMDDGELDSLDFHARQIVTGVAREPTLLVSFIDPNGGDLGPGAGHTSHLFALGDKTGASYEPTYRHAVSGNARTVEFQRLVDHVDVNGDGLDEIILEAWHYGAHNDLVVLSFKAGQWHEALRVTQNWCLDPPPPPKK